MDRYNSTKRAGILGIIGNMFLLILKSFVGFASGSQAMIADAFNSAGDIFASIMTFIGNKISSVPSDESHNFGHGKAEYIFSLFISISMIIVSVKLFYDSLVSLIDKEKIIFSWFLVLTCIITIVTKLALYLYTRYLSKSVKNLLLESNMKDHRNDCIVTTFTLLSVILSKLNLYWFDGIVGTGISIWIFYTGIKIFIESYNVLMDISIDSKTRDIIFDLINEHKEIIKFDEFLSTPIGYKYIITFNIYVDGNLSTFESHKIADNLEKNIKMIETIEKAIIHVQPL